LPSSEKKVTMFDEEKGPASSRPARKGNGVRKKRERGLPAAIAGKGMDAVVPGKGWSRRPTYEGKAKKREKSAREERGGEKSRLLGSREGENCIDSACTRKKRSKKKRSSRALEKKRPAF